MIGLLNLDRVIGLVLGFMLAWAVLAGVNQFIWLPNARDEGRELERADALKKSIELIQKRSETNAEIRNLSARDLCVALDGKFIDGLCQ